MNGFDAANIAALAILTGLLFLGLWAFGFLA